MEHIVDFERCGEIKPVVPISEFFDDCVGAELPRAELSAGLMDVDFVGVRPDLISNVEYVRLVLVFFKAYTHLLLPKAPSGFRIFASILEAV